MRLPWILIALAACGDGKRGDFGDKFYTRPGQRMVCSKGADRTHEWKLDALQKSIDVAKSDGVVLQTYGHAQSLENSGVNIEEFIPLFDYARAQGVPFVTFAQLAHGYEGPGWSFSIDDKEIDTWHGWLPMLAEHGVKLTFFVSNHEGFTDEQKRKLHEIAAAGHDLEVHGRQHLNAKLAVAATGFDAYYAGEVKPSTDFLLAEGFHPTVFAYPFGEHTPEIDAQMLTHFAIVRTTGSHNCW